MSVVLPLEVHAECGRIPARVDAVQESYLIIRRFVPIFTSVPSVLPFLHGPKPNMVPTALVILGMISILPLTLVAARGPPRRRPRQVPCFVS
ncbi:hypothetical protein PF005_g11541 [Phytophthora fragariae]|uniref:Uncharacterized protein n=1 Tax=Phytophthora fragariae TaxID=53985 RepID=A0A6A3XSX8_9STRA|nr:hypothetical protein PF007_g18679 [Phytophthora fragariae]KAE9107834.1 hypothetical protein PF010_g12134 [Phytophthora fragariae]KAE9143759.1 hypothetical protein PF006_g11238 [Phytophthora fragariae]KAE9206865.1 hypothetical protein PF002_g19877 [Phytophthora fragariae]KAE9210169.1 hypothetical protein PF005_g11541 [Phytophthora fragariae]